MWFISWIKGEVENKNLMETHERCPCSSSDVLSIILAEKATAKPNKAQRKIIYSTVAHYLSPRDYESGRIVNLPPCVIQKVRDEYPDSKYSSFDKYSTHLNRWE